MSALYLVLLSTMEWFITKKAFCVYIQMSLDQIYIRLRSSSVTVNTVTRIVNIDSDPECVIGRYSCSLQQVQSEEDEKIV